jgi:hypothetical protein
MCAWSSTEKFIPFVFGCTRHVCCACVYPIGRACFGAEAFPKSEPLPPRRPKEEKKEKSRGDIPEATETKRDAMKEPVEAVAVEEEEEPKKKKEGGGFLARLRHKEHAEDTPDVVESGDEVAIEIDDSDAEEAAEAKEDVRCCVHDERTSVESR